MVLFAQRYIFFNFSGVYNIFVKGGDKENLVGKCDNTGSFGELALMYNMPRAATIQVIRKPIQFYLCALVLTAFLFAQGCAYLMHLVHHTSLLYVRINSINFYKL